MTFQTSVNQQPAPAVAGDFASNNPRSSVLAGPGGLVAAAAGCIVGRFAWVDPSRTYAGNTGAGAPNGFVGNNHNALITTYLGSTSLTIPQGFMVTLFDAGDFWIKNDGTTEVVPGQKAFAQNDSGKAQFAAAGSTITGASVTGSVAASTFSVTASILDNVMTVTAVGSGVVRPGATISGTGVYSGSTVVGQLTGTTGGVGTYQVTPSEQSVASTTVSGTYGTLTVSAVSSGAIYVGDVISGSGVDAGTTVTQQITGAGGTGTYAVSSNTVVSSTAITVAGATETGFYARSNAAAGELVKISSRAMG